MESVKRVELWGTYIDELFYTAATLNIEELFV